jgi:hypothetical protein
MLALCLMNTATPALPANPLSVTMQRIRALHPATLFICLLVWTLLVRLPFAASADDDEFFFALMAQRWLEGQLPYATGFDVKPPGLFLLFLIPQALFGATLATIKGLEIVCVTVAAYSLFDLVRDHEPDRAKPRAAWWAAGLFPIYSLLFSGTNAANLIVQLPFIIFGFNFALKSLSQPNRVFACALNSGLSIGMALMIKQTAVFEAVAVFGLLGWGGASGQRLIRLSAYALGALIPAMLFAAYFAAMGHGHDLFQDVVLSALGRTDPSVLAGYDPALAQALTLNGAFINGLLLSSPAVCLWGGAVFAGLRFARITTAIPSRLIFAALGWLVLAYGGAAYGRVLTTYYLLPIIPPLLVLTSLAVGYGLQTTRLQALGIAAILTLIPIAMGRAEMFDLDPGIKYDTTATRQVGDYLKADGLRPGEALFVFNRGYGIYLHSGGRPVTPYFHATHYLSHFKTPSRDPLGDTLRLKPAYIVVADTQVRSNYDLPQAYDRTFQLLARDYQLRTEIRGAQDSFRIYRRRAS